MFARSPLGFDYHTPERVALDVRHGLARFVRSPEQVFRESTRADGGVWLAVLLLGLLAAAGLVVERVAPRWWRRWWSGACHRVRRSSTGRAAVSLGRRGFLPLALLGSWTLGGLLLGVASVLSELVQTLLGIWAAYRLLSGVAAEGARRLPASEEARGGVLRRTRALLRFAASWGAGWAILAASGYRDEGVALWVSAGHLVLVLGVFGVLSRREAILELLPDLENRAYRGFREFLRAIYSPLVVFSFLVALLWVAGYHNLAAIFLGRSWAIIGLCLLLFGLYHAAQRMLERWVPEIPGREGLREGALAANRQALAGILLLLAWALSLRILGLLEAWIYLLRPVLFRVGSFEISGRAIWASLLILVAAGLFSRWLQATLNFRAYPRFGINLGEAYAINRLLHYAVMSGAVLLVLNTLGISPQSLALVAGGLSVGIGFGLQNIANNIASGLILLTSRQVRQGDVITVGDQTGAVREVNLRSTVVSTFDSVDLIIPNSKLLEDTLVNWTHSGTAIRHRIPFGIAYGADPAAATEVALHVAGEHPEVLPEPPPQVWFKEMGDSALNFEILLWVDMRQSIRAKVASDIYYRMLQEFKEQGIDIPFPQRDLHLRSGVPWEELLGALAGRASERHSGNGREDGSPPEPKEKARAG